MSNPFFKTKALVLREVKYKESDRILTLLSEDRGKITAKARGALGKSGKLANPTQVLMYSDFELLERNGMLTVNEASVIEGFDTLRVDISALSLGCYLAEVTEAVIAEAMPEKEILQLILNSLYATDRNLYSQRHIKAAFELRLSSILGYAPDLDKCAVCGNPDPENPTLGIDTGHLCCRQCRNAEIGITDYLTPEALSSMRYIIKAPPKSIFSYPDSNDKLLFNACEDFMLTHVSRGFKTLSYYKQFASFD